MSVIEVGKCVVVVVVIIIVAVVVGGVVVVVFACYVACISFNLPFIH